MQAQGSLGQLLMQIMDDAKTLPPIVKTKKVFFSDESMTFNQGFEKSDLLRGGSRHPVQPNRGKVDVGGGINSELQATSALLYAACGSMETTMTGGTMGAALAAPTATIDSVNQLMTIAQNAHGVTVGDSVEIAGITAPTSLNGKIFPVVSRPDVNTFKIRLPLGTTTTFTLGAGTIKKVTATGVCTHIIKAGGNLPYYLIEKGFTDVSQFFKFLGAKCGKLGFGVGPSGAVKLSSDWLACSGADPTETSFDSAPIDNGKRSFDNLGLAAADLKEGGTASGQILGIDIALENDLDGDVYLAGGGGSRGSIGAGTYGITGSLKGIFEDVVLYNKAKTLTKTNIDVTYKRGSGDGTDNNESLQIVLPEMNYAPKTPAIAGPKGVLLDLQIMGFVDNHADATALKFVLKNSVLPGLLI